MCIVNNAYSLMYFLFLTQYPYFGQIEIKMLHQACQSTISALLLEIKMNPLVLSTRGYHKALPYSLCFLTLKSQGMRCCGSGNLIDGRKQNVPFLSRNFTKMYNKMYSLQAFCLVLLNSVGVIAILTNPYPPSFPNIFE